MNTPSHGAIFQRVPTHLGQRRTRQRPALTKTRRVGDNHRVSSGIPLRRMRPPFSIIGLIKTHLAKRGIGGLSPQQPEGVSREAQGEKRSFSPQYRRLVKSPSCSNALFSLIHPSSCRSAGLRGSEWSKSVANAQLIEC